jgi:diguanylate cyclase (GGDEF)-like protein
MEKDELKRKTISLISQNGGDFRLSGDLASLSEYTNGGDNIFSRLISAFVDISVGEADAERHWENIIGRHAWLKDRVGGRISIQTAVYDYFLSQTDLVKKPFLVDNELYNLVKKFAVIDGLSGVFNRNYFDLFLSKELMRAMRHNRVFTVLLLDIDDFKRLNDQKGHGFGDTVIRNTARLLKEICRGEDVICRYGGDEFIYFLPETPGHGAFEFSGRLRKKIQEDQFTRENGITLSGGISEFPRDAGSIADLLNHADKALYRAKAEGKDRIVICGNNHRKFERYAKSIEVLFKPLEKIFAEGMDRELVTNDISLEGLRCILADNYQPNTEFVLSFKMFHRQKERMMTFGRIVWSKKLDDSRFMYGIKFQPLEKQRTELLKKMITE